jgi:hypothetical protein
MVSSTIQLLAQRHNLTVDARWTGYCREWTVKDSDGVQLLKTTDYDSLIERLESGRGLRLGQAY